MKYGILVVALVASAVSLGAQQGRGASPTAPAPTVQVPSAAVPQTGPMPWPPLHVYIRAGIKSHGPGQHDYPQFLADWSNILTERGAVVDGGLHFPTTAELAGVNVIVMYKGDAGYMTAEERGSLEAMRLGQPSWPGEARSGNSSALATASNLE